MYTVNIQEFQNHFTKLIEQAGAGETIVILEAGKPRAMLAPFPTGAFPLPDLPGACRETTPIVLPRWPGKVIGSLKREQIYAEDD